MRANSYYQSIILHNNAVPSGPAASLHASNGTLAAIPNVTLLETPWANREPEMDVCWPCPQIVDGAWHQCITLNSTVCAFSWVAV